MRKTFTVDARTILHLGRDSIKDHATALLELIKNSYDADAICVDVEIVCNAVIPYIRIVDNGCGMTETDIENHWLRIGYSEKLNNKFSKRGRRKTGEKGIGRISADRLGSVLSLRTQTENEKAIGFAINWADFEIGKNLSDIEILIADDPSITFPKCYPASLDKQPSGTELIILGLRQQWTQEDIENLYRELSMLVSPFDDVADFNITLSTDIAKGYSKEVESELLDKYEIRLDLEYDGEDDEIRYTLSERSLSHAGEKEKSEKSITWTNLVTQYIEDVGMRFGPARVVLMYYPRIPEIVAGSRFGLGDIREFLKNNAGIKIYRDTIRVKPYGDPESTEGDWLGLGRLVEQNPAGAGRPNFLVRPNQIVGAVFIGRDTNPKLIDSASREGLVQSAEFTALKEFLLGCIRIVSSRYHERFIETQKEQQNELTRRSPSEEVRELAKELRKLQRKLNALRNMVSDEVDGEIEETVTLMDSIKVQIEDTQHSIEDLESQARIYRGLATIGIASTVFGHEIQTSIDTLVGSVNNAGNFLLAKPPKIEKSIESIERANIYANRVVTWGNFALDRVQRDKRKDKKTDIDKIVLQIIEQLEPALTAVDINLQTSLESIEGRVYPTDIEALLINLLTNAYTACNQKRKDKKIRVMLKRETQNGKKGFEIIVSDSGPGVAKQFQKMIWQPLFSTKTKKVGKRLIKIGTGLGLTIAQSIIEDVNGSKKLDKDPELGGARFSFWFPLRER